MILEVGRKLPDVVIFVSIYAHKKTVKWRNLTFNIGMISWKIVIFCKWIKVAQGVFLKPTKILSKIFYISYSVFIEPGLKNRTYHIYMCRSSTSTKMPPLSFNKNASKIFKFLKHGRKVLLY